MEHAAQIIDAIGSILWPTVFVILIWRSKEPLQRVLENLAEVVSKAQTIKLSRGIVLSRSDVQSALVDREHLKIGIIVAAADFPDKSELVELSGKAKGMRTHLESLSTREHKELFAEAIDLASQDGNFSAKELEALRTIGRDHGLTPSVVAQQVKKFAEAHGIKMTEVEHEL